jgi:organic hydroperoxide reductase OsmC/OhrA
MSEPNEIRVVLTQQQGYAFLVDFGDALPDLLTDEPAPLGAGSGPNPSRLLLAAIANCLSASLVFALRKFKNQPGPIRAEIVGELVRNAEGRWRIPKAEVEIHLAEAPGELEHLDRVLDQFEQFCVVTQSVRDGIDVAVTVRDAEGRVLKGDKSFEAGA